MQNMQRILNIFINSGNGEQQPPLQTLSVVKPRDSHQSNLMLLKIIQAARNSEAVNQENYDYN